MDGAMQDDNPLWYDYAEPDEAPSRSFLALAFLFGAAVSSVRGASRVYGLPDLIWCGAVDALARYRATGMRRP